MSKVDELWDLVRGPGPIDARRLFDSLVGVTAALDDADPRTQMLVRDGFDALRVHWGLQRLTERLSLHQIEPSRMQWPAPEEGRFHTLEDRVVDATDPSILDRMLRDLGLRVREPATIIIGGSLALMRDGWIVRATDDADVVDELPPTLRDDHELLADLTARYGLKLAHFQSHYLPNGWRDRVRSLGRFGAIDAFLVDPVDVLVGKLFSRRTKDFVDVQVAWPRVGRDALADRVGRTTASFRKNADLLAVATRNWYVLTGESTLP